jgi:hypothetical protein
MVLKPNMVISGKKCPTQAGAEEVAERTLDLLYRTVPAAVPVADAAERHEAAERPLIDSLGSTLRLAPILMVLALAGALCAASRLRRA